MTTQLKKYKLLLFIAIILSLIFPSLVFSYTNIEISNISLRKTETERLLIEWETNLKTEANVVYGKNRNALSHRKYEGKQASVKHKIEIDDLEEGELYYFQLVSKNSVKAVRSKIFERYIDVRREDISLIENLKVDNFLKKSTGSQGTVEFETNFPSTGSLSVKKNNLLIKEINFAYAYNHSAVITGLEPATCYDLYINLTDSYNRVYSDTYSLCTLKRSVLPVSKSGHWTDKNATSSPQSFVTENGVIVAGIEYEHFPKIQAIYKTNDSPKIWLIANNQRHLITSPGAFDSYGFLWADVETVPWPQIAKYKLAKLVKAPNSTVVYFLHERKNGTIGKIVIPSSYVFDSYSNNRREDIVTVSQRDIDSYENVALLRSISNGHIYYVSGNEKHYIAKDVLDVYNFDEDDILNVNTIHFSRYTAGDGLK